MGTYDAIAREITKGNFLAGAGTESPLYPRVFLPMVYLLTGGDLLTARLVQAGLNAINILLIYIIARRLFSRPTGIAAAVIAILYIPFIVYSGAMLSETLLNTTILVMMLMLLDLRLRRTETAPVSHFFIAGASIGLAAAAKPTVLLFAPVALLWAILEVGEGAMRRFSRAIICLAGIVVVMMPFIVWGYLITGSVIPLRGNSGEMFLMGNSPSATGAFCAIGGEIGEKYKKECAGKSLAEQDRIAYRLAFEFIRNNPRAFLQILVRKLRLFWGYREIGNNLSVTYYRQISFLSYPPFLSFGLILPAAIIGAFVALPRFRTVWILYAFILVYTVSIALFVVVGRYRLAVVPLLIVFAGHGLASVGRWLANRRYKPAIGAIAVMAVLTIFIYSEYLWRGFFPLIEGPLANMGFSWRVTALGPDEFVIKDDTGQVSDYGALLRPGEAARKVLFVPRERLERAKRASIQVYCTQSDKARWRLTLNGKPPQTAGQPFQIPGGIEVPIQPTELKESANEIVIESVEGWIKVALDDYYDFNRSAVRTEWGEWRTSRLDTETCKAIRSLHIADGEFLIHLRIETKEKKTPPKPA